MTCLDGAPCGKPAVDACVRICDSRGSAGGCKGQYVSRIGVLCGATASNSACITKVNGKRSQLGKSEVFGALSVCLA